MAFRLPPGHLEDLLQEGAIGILLALKTHDYTKGHLTTHIYYTAKGKMSRYTETNYLCTKRDNKNFRQLFWKGEIPRDASLDDPIPLHPNITFADLLPDISESILTTLIREEEISTIQKVLSKMHLSSREKTILKERLLIEDYSSRARLREIAKREGVSYEAIRTSENRLKRRIKQRLLKFNVSGGYD